MAAFRLLLCFLISTLWFCSLINAAAVHTMIFGDSFDALKNVEDNRVAIEEIDNVDGALEFPVNIRSRRSTESEKVCHSTTPCGWAVYVPFTRRVDYFMKNTCSCPSAFKCIRTDDDLSVSAYVYRCRNNVSASDIESPDDANSN